MTRWFRMLTMAVVLTLLFAACGDDGDDEAGSDTTAAATDTTAAADDDGDDGGGGAGSEVTIADFAFDPGDLTVAVGDSVTWANEDGATHTVTSDDDAFDSGDLSSGATFEETFDEAGTFAYHCDIHPQMSGTVTVQ